MSVPAVLRRLRAGPGVTPAQLERSGRQHEALTRIRNLRAAHRIASETGLYFIGCARRAVGPVESVHCSELGAEWFLRAVRLADELDEQKRALRAMKASAAE